MTELPVSQFRYRSYAANSVIALHSHTLPTLTLVLDGIYEERIAGRAAERGEGTILVCPEATPHAQRFGSRGVRKIIVTPAATLLDYLKTVTPFDTAPAASSALIGRLIRQIDAEHSLSDSFAMAAMEGALWQIAAELGRSLAEARRPASSIARQARRILDELEDEPMSVSALSRETDCHPATLIRAFRRHYGCTPGDYQRQRRVERAARLLRETTMPVAEVAVSCGFCDQSHLTRSFRHILGCTPSFYRRRA